MFAKLTVKQLKALISAYKAFHDIKGYHKMNKLHLVNALDQRFVVKDHKLHLKSDVVGSDSDEMLPYTALEDGPKVVVEAVGEKYSPEKKRKKKADIMQRAMKLKITDPAKRIRYGRKVVPDFILAHLVKPTTQAQFEAVEPRFLFAGPQGPVRPELMKFMIKSQKRAEKGTAAENRKFKNDVDLEDFRARRAEWRKRQVR